MTFHALVEFVKFEEQTVKSSKGGKSKLAVWIFVRDVESRRMHCLGDWSGDVDNAKLMESCKGSTLEVQGFVNPKGKIHFAVLQQWGVWDAEQRRVFRPDTREDGYVSIAKEASEETE